MAVFRLERTGNFTVMANLHLRDKSLSLKAKGLLSQMLSLPEDWDYTLAGLASINAEGKDAIRSAVVELERAGYVTRSRERDKLGCWGGAVYVIREAPVFFESPAPVEPASGNPAWENPTQLKNQSNKKTDPQNTDVIPSPSSPSKTAGVQGDAVQAHKNAAEPQERKEWKRTRRDAVSQNELDTWREHIRENIRYEDFVAGRPYDAGRLDEMVELMVEAVCSRKATLRAAGCEFPQTVIRSRLLKLGPEHIRFVFDCLQENTTQVRNMKQYLLTVLFNAPVTIDSHYAAQVNHDLYGESG